jgi:signal transduction histidine kinase
MAARTASGDQQLIYVLQATGEASTKVFGFTVNTVQVADVMRDTFNQSPLLPTSLADGRLSNDLLFAEVSTPEGNILFETNRHYNSHLSVNKVLGDDYQGILDGFRIQVSVDPDSASSLLIGGLPESRLPWLLAIMVMAVILMVTAIWLFRREHAVMKLRSDFISQVSHELRTPLTQIRMFAETLLLKRTRTEDESRRSLEIIDRESRRLSHLVENILLFSNVSDASHFDRRSQALAPIVRAVCDTVQATANDVSIQLSADESVSANVDADALHQVVLNVLDNAIKYGPKTQEISVGVKAVNDTVQISIADQGPGIPVAEQERVWAAFYRLKREQQTAISGTGIGLSVVRELVEAMDGRCWIDTTTAGTRVIVNFRREDSHG